MWSVSPNHYPSTPLPQKVGERKKEVGTRRRTNDRCKQFFNHPQPRPSTSSTPNAESSKPKTRGRGIGSDKNPLDMAYYDVLGLDSQCTQDEIKKAYRRLAIKVSKPGYWAVKDWLP
jgi:hypothetical protein